MNSQNDQEINNKYDFLEDNSSSLERFIKEFKKIMFNVLFVLLKSGEEENLYLFFFGVSADYS